MAVAAEGRKVGQSLALSTKSSEDCPTADPSAKAASPAADSSTKSASVTAAA